MRVGIAPRMPSFPLREAGIAVSLAGSAAPLQPPVLPASRCREMLRSLTSIQAQHPLLRPRPALTQCPFQPVSAPMVNQTIFSPNI